MSSLTSQSNSNGLSKKPAASKPATQVASKPATQAASKPATQAASKPATQVASKPATPAVQSKSKEKPEKPLPPKNNSDEKSKHQKKTPPAGKYPPKTADKACADWRTPDKPSKKSAAEKKQAGGRSSKPRTPQMERKRANKKSEAKPAKQRIQYERSKLMKIRQTVLELDIKSTDLDPHYYNEEGVWEPFRWHTDQYLKEYKDNKPTNGNPSPMKKRANEDGGEVKKQQRDISLKPRLSFAGGASGFSNSKKHNENNDDESKSSSIYKAPSRRFEDSDSDRFGNGRGRFSSNRPYDSRNYKPQQPYQPPQMRSYNDKNTSWRNNSYNKYNDNNRGGWGNYQEETPEWMNDDVEEGEEDLACFEDELTMLEDVDLTAQMPMGDLGDRFEIKKHHLKQDAKEEEEVNKVEDDSFEDPAIVNSKREVKNVERGAGDMPEDPAIVSYNNNKNTVRDTTNTGSPLDNILKLTNQKQEIPSTNNNMAQGDFEAMLKKANNKDSFGLDSRMNNLKLNSESIWNKPNNNKIAAPMTTGSSLATNSHMATNRNPLATNSHMATPHQLHGNQENALSKLLLNDKFLSDKLLSDKLQSKLERSSPSNLAPGSNIQQGRNPLIRGMPQSSNKFDQMRNQMNDQGTSGLANLLPKPPVKTGGYNTEKLEELKKVLGQSNANNQIKKPEPTILQQPSTIGLPTTSIPQLGSLQVRTTPQVQQTQQQNLIAQQRNAWTHLILQQLGCKTQQQMMTMLANPAQRLLIEQSVNKKVHQTIQHQQAQQQQLLQQQQIQQQRIRQQLLAQQQSQGVSQQQILAVLQQQQMKTPQQILVQQQLLKQQQLQQQQQHHQNLILQQRRNQIIQQQLAAQQAGHQFGSIQGNTQQQNQQQMNNISAYLQQNKFNNGRF